MTAQPTLNEHLYWNWGVPDWRDERTYLAALKLTARQWRWEFLRRRPSYREVWVRLFWKMREEAESNKPTLRRGPGWSKEEELETIGPWWWGGDDNWFTVKDPSRQFCDWQLEHALGYSDFLERRIPERLQPHRPPGRTEQDWNLDEAELWKFDLTEPLPQQFARAKAHLTARQKALFGNLNSPKPRRTLWPLYLRALDAKDAGASYDLMYKMFWPDDFEKKTPQSARDVYEAAVALRNNFPF